MGLIYGPFAGITGHFDMLGMLDQDLCTEILKIAKEMRKWPGNGHSGSISVIGHGTANTIN